jgi:tRNA pseudouridine55 synthase
MDGILNIDKPPGPSSAAVLNRLKRLVPRGTKVGHAGTLDPFATGVLLVLVGRGTKLCERLMDLPKQYDATVRLGATTATDDPASPPQPWPDAVPPTAEQVAAALPRFVGRILQRPPPFSAIKVDGRRAYDLARGGADVALPPRPVDVYAIELLAYDWPILRIRVDCGRGTYVRAIARDLGEALNVGGHLTDLRRTRVGPFDVTAAVTPDALAADTIEGRVVPLTSELIPPRREPLM